MSGQEIREEIEKRKGSMPSPGTIYPVLKKLKHHNFIEEIKTEGREKKYKLTKEGKDHLKEHTKMFLSIFEDMKEEFEKMSK